MRQPAGRVVPPSRPSVRRRSVLTLALARRLATENASFASGRMKYSMLLQCPTGAAIRRNGRTTGKAEVVLLQRNVACAVTMHFADLPFKAEIVREILKLKICATAQRDRSDGGRSFPDVLSHMRTPGLEPGPREGPAPKAGASTNFATSAANDPNVAPHRRRSLHRRKASRVLHSESALPAFHVRGTFPTRMPSCLPPRPFLPAGGWLFVMEIPPITPEMERPCR